MVIGLLSMGRRFSFSAPSALVEGNQSPLLDIKLPLGNHLPLMKATAAQCFTLVLFFGAGPFEGNDVVAHSSVSWSVPEL